MPRGEHYTKNTEAVTAWCQRCRTHTRHRVDGGIIGPCDDCTIRTRVASIVERKARGELVPLRKLLGKAAT